MKNHLYTKNIGIDCRTLLGPQTGIARYTQQLITEFQALNLDLSLYYNQNWHQNTPVQPSNKDNNFFPVLTRAIPETLHFHLKYARYYSEQKKFCSSLNHCKPSIIHFPDFFSFESGTPSIITIHDISCLNHPEFHPNSRVKWHEKMLPRSIDNAQHIITVSNFSKTEIIKYLGVPENKVSVTYNGVSKNFRPLPTSITAPILNKYQLKYKSYFLYVGTLEPRKNLNTILKAFKQLPKSVQLNYPLVLSGLKGWKISTLLTQYQSHINDGRIRVLGFIPANDLPAIYNGATIFLYPSFYEGFGLPPLEAMACGTVTMVSNRTALPEVVGKTGITLNAEDNESWGRNIQEIIENNALANKHIQMGLQQAQKFTWEKCALQTLNIYSNIDKT